MLEFIATNITDNIRVLEGALIRVAAFASLTAEQLTVEHGRVGPRRPPHRHASPGPITPQVILEATSKMFGIPIEEIIGKKRQRPLVTARQVAMYVFRELTDLSYPAIAREFGGRDHTTVIHAVEKISAQMRTQRPTYDQVTELVPDDPGRGVTTAGDNHPDDLWTDAPSTGRPPVGNLAVRGPRPRHRHTPVGSCGSRVGQPHPS